MTPQWPLEMGIQFIFREQKGSYCLGSMAMAERLYALNKPLFGLKNKDIGFENTYFWGN